MDYIKFYIKLRRLYQVKYHKNVLLGFKHFDKPLLVSYSRSGTNWLRYFIETVTNQSTPGQRRVVDGYNYYIDRAHAGYERMNKYKNVIILVRNYKECLIRHHGLQNIRSNYNNMQDFLNDESLNQPVSWYIKNIAAFEKFKYKKLLIYYENLIRNPIKNFQEIAEFLNVDKSETEDFVKNLDFHKSNSISIITKGGHVSETQGDPLKLKHHSSKLDINEIRIIDNHFKSKNNKLYTKYLERYEEGKIL